MDTTITQPPKKGGRVLTDLSGGEDTAHAVVVQRDGNIVAAGWSEQGRAAARYFPDGRLDPAFGRRGKLVTDPDRYVLLDSDGGIVVAVWPKSKRKYLSLSAFAIQADGKIVGAGSIGPSAGNFALARFDRAGRLDPSFGDHGMVETDFAGGTSAATAVAVQDDGKIVAVGSWGDGAGIALARYTVRGRVDRRFGAGGTVASRFASGAGAVALQPDGKIVVAGLQIGSDDVSAPTLGRYTGDGRLDTGFGSKGMVLMHFPGKSASAQDVAVQEDGKIVVALEVDVAPRELRTDIAVARFLPNGHLDARFGERGVATDDRPGSEDFARAVAIQPDGKIVVAGSARVEGAGGDFALVRFREDGRIDRDFGAR